MFSVFVVKANKYFKAGVGKFLLVLVIRQKKKVDSSEYYHRGEWGSKSLYATWITFWIVGGA